jgi:hypothetical protein
MKEIRGIGGKHVATLLDKTPKRKRSLKSKVKARRVTTVRRSNIQTNVKRTSKRSTMAGKRKSGSKRKRDKRGHFISAARKATRRTAKANPRKHAKKRTAKKRTAKRRGVVRIKRALGRKKSSGQFTRRSKHRVRGYRRKVKGRAAKKLIRSHLSYENPITRKRRRPRRATEASMAQANPRRRRRASKRRHTRHHAVMENPRPRKRRRARRAMENPRKTKRRSSRRTTAMVPAVVRRRTRKGGSRTSPGKIVVQIAGLGGARRRKPAKRRSSARKSKSRKTKRKSGHRKGYTRKSHQLGMGSAAMEAGFFENPLGGNFLENPLSGGELALAAFTGTIGFALTDMLDRYLAIKQYASAANGVTIQPSAAPRTVPSITRILAQAAAAAVPLGAAYFVKEPVGRAALQGIGLGAVFHLGGQLLNHYVMTWLGGKITAVAPLYQMETQADSAAAAWAGAAGSAPPVASAAGTLSGAPAPKALRRTPIVFGTDPGPRATGVAAPPAATGVAAPPAATGVGECQDDGGGAGTSSQLPPGVGAGNGCGPTCDPTDSGSTASSQAAATQATNSTGSLQGLGSPYDMFGSSAD